MRLSSKNKRPMMHRSIKKNRWFYGGIVGTWLLCLVHFDPKLFSVVTADDSFIAKGLFAVFVLFLNLFWLYGIFHCYFLIYRLVPKRTPSFFKSNSSISSPVAILYTTRNDFQTKAALSCLQQSYQHFHLFILDDSTEDSYKKKVDDFHDEFPGLTTIIRRKDRKGFKAGNLNNALRHYVTGYDYFAVIDADEVAPHDFLKKLMPYFGLDENIAFVQAHHEQNAVQPSKFAQDLSLGINFHWDIYQPPRNDCGFVIFYGHGAIIRRDVWEKVGGFPEIVSEDLAFAARIRQLGFRGHFAREVTCYEDFPETYQQFRKRHEKWVKGACEYLHREFWPFLRSKRVTLPEKLDVLFSSFSLFIPALFLIYLFLANAVLPMLLAEKHMLQINLFGTNYELMPAYFMEPRFAGLWTVDFYLMTLVGMFSPIFCYFGKVLTNPKSIIKLLFKSAVPYISLILVASCGILTYIFTKKAVFFATGDKSDSSDASSEGKNEKRFWEKLNANHPLIFHLEWLLGVLLTYFSVKTMNFALLTISSCLILSPLVARYEWGNKAISCLVSLPLLFVLLAFGSMGTGFLGINGFSLYFLAMHF